LTVQHRLFNLLFNLWRNKYTFFFDFTKHSSSFFSELFLRSSFMLWIYCFNALTYRRLMHANLFLSSYYFDVSFFFIRSIWRRLNFLRWFNSCLFLMNKLFLKQIFVFEVSTLRVLLFNFD
jgi:hypothetical protein